MSLFKKIISKDAEESSKRVAGILSVGFIILCGFVFLVLTILILMKAIPATQRDKELFFDLFGDIVLYILIYGFLAFFGIAIEAILPIFQWKFAVKKTLADLGIVDQPTTNVGKVETQNITGDVIQPTDAVKATGKPPEEGG